MKLWIIVHHFRSVENEPVEGFSCESAYHRRGETHDPHLKVLEAPVVKR
jgi:hypothetical protein